jgi:hypothetical protein
VPQHVGTRDNKQKRKPTPQTNVVGLKKGVFCSKVVALLANQILAAFVS